MSERKNDSPRGESADLVASLLMRIDRLVAQISARDARIDELLALVKAQNMRIFELEAKCGRPPRTPDNSSLPPSRGQKGNAKPLGGKQLRKGRPGVARKLAENPDATRRFFAEHCACGAELGEARQELAKEYDHIDIPPIRPVTTRIELFRATCPCCKARVTASAPADMPEGSPFGSGIASMTAYLHGCQMIGYKRLAAQLGHAEEHQFCLAHLIRDAQYAIDHGDTIFAPGFKALLQDACAVGRRRPDLADATIAAHRRRLERKLERLLALKPTDAEGRKLRDTVYVDCTDKLFVFLKRRDAEPTNNESERALRPSVIFRKVTNGFRSEWGAKTYAALRSIVETGRRNGRSALTAIRDALAVPTPDTIAA